MRRALALFTTAALLLAGCGAGQGAYAPGTVRAAQAVQAKVKVLKPAERGALKLESVKETKQTGFAGADGFEFRGHDAQGPVFLVVAFHKAPPRSFDSDRFTFVRNWREVVTEEERAAIVKQLQDAQLVGVGPETVSGAQALIKTHFRPGTPDESHRIGADWFEPITITAIERQDRPGGDVRQVVTIKGKDKKGPLTIKLEALDWKMPANHSPVTFLRVTVNGKVETAFGIVRWWHTAIAHAELAPELSLDQVGQSLAMIENVGRNWWKFLQTADWPGQAGR